MEFFLGAPTPSDALKLRDIPVCLSANALVGRKSPLSIPRWILDSGGYTAISRHGTFTLSKSDYLNMVATHRPSIAFCQDWMCEPHILRKTGLTVADHQRNTIDNYLYLAERDCRICPVLQGWTVDDYVNHVKMYRSVGVPLVGVVGVGSVCSRNTDNISALSICTAIRSAAPEAKLHGFGVKSTTLVRAQHLLSSADSMAWSFSGRYAKHPDCSEGCVYASCSNCLVWARRWRNQLLQRLQEWPGTRVGWGFGLGE